MQICVFNKGSDSEVSMVVNESLRYCIRQAKQLKITAIMGKLT